MDNQNLMLPIRPFPLDSNFISCGYHTNASFIGLLYFTSISVSEYCGNLGEMSVPVGILIE